MKSREQAPSYKDTRVFVGASLLATVGSKSREQAPSYKDIRVFVGASLLATAQSPRCSMRFWTTAGSASVEMSPKLSSSFAAILRRMRRMILPDRVFGKQGAH